MKLTINKSNLLDALAQVQNAVAWRTTLPVLKNIHLRADANTLELTATDLDLYKRCKVDASVERAGGTTLPARTLMAITKEIAGTEVSMDTNNRHRTQIESGNTYYKLSGIPGDEFPSPPKIDDAKTIEVPQSLLGASLAAVDYAASTDKSRYVLNCVRLSIQKDHITTAATDGRRLAQWKSSGVEGNDATAAFLVPNNAVRELRRMLTGSGAAHISGTSAHLVVQAGRASLLTKLIEGSYPDVGRAIPTETGERVAVQREALLAAVRRASLLTGPKHEAVKLSFQDNMLHITANDPEAGEAREELAIAYRGKPVAVAFNPLYLAEPLDALPYSELSFEFTDDRSAGVFKFGDEFLYVVMPVRLS